VILAKAKRYALSAAATPVENLAGTQIAQGSFGVALEALIQATSD
jgi:hypothetical protein